MDQYEIAEALWECKKKISKAIKEYFKDPEIKNRMSKAIIEYYKDPENLIKISCRHQGILREEWTHFVSYEPYCQEFTREYKEFIKERDNNECQNPNCNKEITINNHLCVHHIDYNKKNCKPENLLSLCNSCNSIANGNREYWQEFYTKIMEKGNYK